MKESQRGHGNVEASSERKDGSEDELENRGHNYKG